MGYRSDVRISLSTDGFNELSSYVYDYFKNSNKHIQYNLLEHMDICHKSKNRSILDGMISNGMRMNLRFLPSCLDWNI